MELGIIAAIGNNGVIGKDGKLPWPKISEDLGRFKELTSFHPVIMGRKTFESIGKPLSNRLNVVISRGGFRSRGIYVRNSLEEAINFLDLRSVRGIDYSRGYVIGGGEIYTGAFPLINFMKITEVHKSYSGDVYFPKFDKGEWNEISREQMKGFDFVSYLRK
jgi:dihydrofolate reductase